MNSAQGESYTAGWMGGEITGSITGLGFGVGTALKLGFGASELVAIGGGFFGGVSGSTFSQLIDTGHVDAKDAIFDGLINGLFAGVAGAVGQIPAAIKGTGLKDAISAVAYGSTMLINETVFDGFSTYITSVNGASLKKNVYGMSLQYTTSTGIPKLACGR